MLDQILFDVEQGGLADATGEPNIEDSLSHGLTAGCERYYPHLLYYRMRRRYSVIAAVITSTACLESYVNEIIYLTPALSEPQRKSLLRRSLRDKYNKFFNYVSGEPFETGAEPFDSFSLLVDIRNSLVHFSPWHIETLPNGRPHKFLRLADKIPELDSGFSFPEGLIEPAFFMWVRRTVSSIMRAINKHLPNNSICLDVDTPSHVIAVNWEAARNNK